MLPLALAASLACPALAPQDAVDRWARALVHVAQHDLEWEVALHLLDAAEAAIPGTAELAYQRAVTLARAGRRAEALEALNEARRRGWLEAAVTRWDEGLASLRDDAGFDAITTAMDADAKMRARDATLAEAPGESQAGALTEAPAEARMEANLRWALTNGWDRNHATAIAPFDEGRCIVGSSDGDLFVLDVRTGLGSPRNSGQFARHPAAIGAIAVDPRGELVAASSADGRVALWATATPDRRGVVGFPGGYVKPGCVIRTGEELWDDAVRVAWSVDGSHLMTFAPYWLHGPPKAPVQLFDRAGDLVFTGIDAWYAALSPTEPLIAAVHADELQLAWPGVRDQRISLPGAQDGVAFSPDGKRVAVGGRDDRLWILDSATGAVLVESRIGLVERDLIFHPVITRLHWSPDGQWLGGTVGKGCNVVGIDPETGKLAWMSGTLGARMYFVFDAHWTADSRLLLYGFGHASCVSPSTWEASPAPVMRLPLGEVAGVAPVSEPVEGNASVIASRSSVARVRHADGTIDWSRIEGSSGFGFLVRDRSGYVDGFPWSDTVALLGPDGTTRHVPLVDVYSPKRVAAIRAGVTVLPLSPPR